MTGEPIWRLWECPECGQSLGVRREGEHVCPHCRSTVTLIDENSRAFRSPDGEREADDTLARALRSLTCSRCNERFDPEETASVFNGDTARYQCPHCGKWMKGLSPG